MTDKPLPGEEKYVRPHVLDPGESKSSFDVNIPDYLPGAPIEDLWNFIAASAIMVRGIPTATPPTPDPSELQQWLHAAESTSGEVEALIVKDLTPDLAELSSRIAALEAQVEELVEEFAERPRVSSIQLHDLGPHPVKIVRPLSVVIEETDEEALASWPEANVHTVGVTPADAIARLKSSVADLFLDFDSSDPHQLGELAEYSLHILRVHLESA